MTCASPAATIAASFGKVPFGSFWMHVISWSFSRINRIIEKSSQRSLPRSRSTELMRRNKVCSRSSSTVGTFGSAALTFQDRTCNDAKPMMFKYQNMSCQGHETQEHYQWFNQEGKCCRAVSETAVLLSLVSEYFISVKDEFNPSVKCQSTAR